MALRIRLNTHETIVHSQLQAIEKALSRTVVFEITLNQKGIKSNIEFEAEEKEISVVKNDLGYNVMVFDGERWLPHL
jgi:hypothetical protein